MCTYLPSCLPDPDLYAVEGQRKRTNSTVDSAHEDGAGTVSYAEAHAFNCIQRAHQNQCENLPMFLVILLLAGSAFPLWGGLAGLTWVAGRFAYAQGYYTGQPDKRNRGSFAYIGYVSLLVMLLIFAFYNFKKKQPY